MSKLEDIVVNILINEKIDFIREKTFPDLKHGYYRFDFYLPTKNILIEVDGIQHMQFTKIFYKKRADFLKAQERDRRKNSYALAHNIPLYRLPVWEMMNLTCFNDILADKFLVKSQYHNDMLKVPKEYKQN